jgi:hypothetical protein
MVSIYGTLYTTYPSSTLNTKVFICRHLDLTTYAFMYVTPSYTISIGNVFNILLIHSLTRRVESLFTATLI